MLEGEYFATTLLYTVYSRQGEQLYYGDNTGGGGDGGGGGDHVVLCVVSFSFFLMTIIFSSLRFSGRVESTNSQ